MEASEPSLASKHSPQALGWLRDTRKGAGTTGDSQGSQYTQTGYNRTFTKHLTKAMPDLLVIHHIPLSQKGKQHGDKTELKPLWKDKVALKAKI